jgi:hypothetical protein
MTDESASRFQEFLDRQDIHDVAMRYCRACDRIDSDLLRTVFHEDAYIEYGVFDGVATEFVPWVIDHIREGYVHGYHAITNEYVFVEGDVAHAELYAIINNMVVDEEGQFIENTIWGRYIDRYERRKGEWRIAHRQFLLDSIESRPSSDQQREHESDEGAQLGRGRRSQDDGSYSVLPAGPKRALDW